MTGKDLLSINEAFAKATSKVATDEPAKKDEVVTEGTEPVKEDWDDGADIDPDPEADAAVAAAGSPEDDNWVPKEGDKVALQDGSNEIGIIVAVGSDDQYKIEFDNPDRPDAVHPKDDLALDQPSADEANSYSNVMDDYENSLTSSKYKVREKTETGKDFKKPDEKVSEVDSKNQRPKGEVKADEKSKDVGGAEEDLQEPVEASTKEEEKKPKKKKKLPKESINNCNKGNIMSEDKSIFDKLYESVMGEDDDFELGIPGDDEAGLDAGDEFGDEGGEEVTVTLTPDQAAALKAVVDQLPSDDEEELGDVGDEDPLADTDELADAVQEDTTQTGDGKKPGTDPSDGGGKTTDPAADSLGGKTSGDGAVPVTDKEGTEQTGDGKKPGVAKNSGKPGKQAV